MAAYEVRLTADGRDLEGIEQTSSGTKRYDTDPGTSWFLRREVDFLSILPIEGVTLAGDSLMLGGSTILFVHCS